MSPAERWSLHRSELVRATAAACNESPGGIPSIDAVVRRAGKGRNTFYAHFSGLEEALRAVESTVASAANQRLDPEAAVTPGTRLRSLVAAWVEVARAEPELSKAALRGPGGRCAELARRQLASVAETALRDGILARAPDALRITAAVGALFAVVESQAEVSGPVDEVARETVDILLRIFR